MIVNDSKSIVSELNKFFGSATKEIDEKIPNSERGYTEYLKNRSLDSFLLKPVTKIEIEKIIKMFSEKRALGPHSIPTNIPKEYKKIFLHL